MINIPAGYEPIDGSKYPTKELQRANYDDIRVYTAPSGNGSFLYGKPKFPKAPKPSKPPVSTHQPTKLLYPLDKIYVTQKFGERPLYYRRYGLPGHNGVDFRTRFVDSPLGRRYVTACADGKIEVVRADAGGYGTHIRQRLSDGSLIIYGHLTKSYVSKGQSVKAGDRIALTGNTGDSSGPHLHLELRLPGWENKKLRIITVLLIHFCI